MPPKRPLPTLLLRQGKRCRILEEEDDVDSFPVGVAVGFLEQDPKDGAPIDVSTTPPSAEERDSQYWATG